VIDMAFQEVGFLLTPCLAYAGAYLAQDKLGLITENGYPIKKGTPRRAFLLLRITD